MALDDRKLKQNQLELKKSQLAVNRAILLATWVLALAAILSEWPPDKIGIPGWFNQMVLWGGIAVGIVILGLLAHETIQVYKNEI